MTEKQKEIVNNTKAVFLEDSEHLRKQLQLLAEMSTKCPEFIGEYSEQMVKIFTVLYT